MASDLRLVEDMALGQPFRINTWKQCAAVIVLALAFTTACSRQVVDASQRVLATSGQDSPAVKNGSSPTRALPDVVVPIGTPIVIRLQSALSSAASHSGETFEAALDEPIVSQGETMVPRGAAVSGRVISASSSGSSSQPGYLRLALSTLRLDRRTLELHTSAVFAKGTWRDEGSEIGLQSVSASSTSPAAAREVEFSTGRQLVFFLVQPLPFRE